MGDFLEPIRTWNPSRVGGDDFMYVDVSAVDSATKRIARPVRVGAAEAPSRARRLIRTGDVLVSTVRPNLNAIAVVPPTLDGATASTGFAVLRPSSELDERYLFHWVRTPAFVSDMVKKSTGASYPAVSERIVKESNIPLPSAKEQRRIAGILDAADAIRSKRKAVVAHVDALTHSVFNALFGELEASSTVGELATIQGGLQVSTARARHPVEVPYLRVANAHRGRFDLAEIKTLRATEAEVARTRLIAGDLLFVEGHANPAEVGRVARWSDQIPLCVHQNHLIRARLDTSRLLPRFAEMWLNSDPGARHFRRAGRTTSGLNTISASTVRSAPIAVPPLADQQAFVARVAHIDAVRTTVQRALADDDELFASLQSRAFSGML